MACAACGQKRVGFAASMALVMGSDAQMDPIYVLVKQNGVLPSVRVGEYRWVTGSGVAQAIADGLIQESGARQSNSHISPSEVWCVTYSGTERCFRTLEQATRYSQANNSPVEHRILR